MFSTSHIVFQLGVKTGEICYAFCPSFAVKEP